MSRNLRLALCGLVSATVLSSIGCGPSQTMNPWTLRKENGQLKSALRQYQDQVAREKQRSEGLDSDNEELHNMLAQEQDARRRAESEQSRLTQRAPRPTVRDDEYGDDEKAYGQATGRRGGSGQGTQIASNDRDSRGGNLPTANIPGAQVVRDGDAVRIRVTNTSLFDPGKANLKPGATKVLDQVSSQIRRSYPGQLIGIEGHTDSDPIRKSNWKDNHELSYERARAVYDYLSSRGGIPANQLYVAAYGENNPIASNGSSAGKAQNRRVEFVVRPNEATGRQ